eukprot:Nk52_evm8s232 gene=Nk52_evmTU8s232
MSLFSSLRSVQRLIASPRLGNGALLLAQNGEGIIAKPERKLLTPLVCGTGTLVRSYSSHPSPKSDSGPVQRISLTTLKKKYKENIPLVMMTAHDYPSGMACDKGDCDIILVGDSLAMVALGMEDTTQITLDEMIHHAKAVYRGSKRCFLVGDMPFGSYQISPEKTIENCFRMVKEAQVESVKMEGGQVIADTVKRVVQAGIPVLGHIGLTPQSKAALGGFRVQGKNAVSAVNLVKDALALQEAGCWGVVIEAVPDKIAKYITEQLTIPTIGIGAGNVTDGQVLVQLDTLGVFDRFLPKFCKQYGKLAEPIQKAVNEYATEVRDRSFPGPEHCYPISDQQYEMFLNFVSKNKLAAPGSFTHLPKREMHTTSRGHVNENNTKTKIAVVGAGALGSFLGGKLSGSSEVDVVFLDSWEEMVSTVNTKGLVMQNEKGEKKKVTDVKALNHKDKESSIYRELQRAAKIVIVSSKCHHTEKYIDTIDEILCPKEGIIVVVQNGIGIFDRLRKRFGKERTTIGIVNYGSKILETGRIQHTNGGSIFFGDSSNELVVRGVGILKEQLLIAGFDVKMKPDLRKIVFQKLMVNACINPLTSLLNVPNGYLKNDTYCIEMINSIVKECIEIARGVGYEFDHSSSVEHVLHVADMTQTNISSMLQDVRRGADTEIDFINGQVVRLGKKYGIPTPLNYSLLNLVHALENTHASKGRP